MADALPLFPLQAVLFPGGLLELKVFEARYLDLISRCLREQRPFGVVAPAAAAARRARPASGRRFDEVGTLAELIDVDSAQAGILQVRCRGAQRFRLGARPAAPTASGCAEATTLIDDERRSPRRGACRHGARPGRRDRGARRRRAREPFLEPHRFDDAGWVANRWCEILPIPLAAKQS